jgi:hypothetical protein
MHGGSRREPTHEQSKNAWAHSPDREVLSVGLRCEHQAIDIGARLDRSDLLVLARRSQLK